MTFVGTSGWHYKHWIGPFYPKGLSPSKMLQWYAERFNTVEINNSFYRLPPETAVQTWRDTVPRGFRFAVKGSRFITHMKKAEGPGTGAGEVLLSRRSVGSEAWSGGFSTPAILEFGSAAPRDISGSAAKRTSVRFRIPE